MSARVAKRRPASGVKSIVGTALLLLAAAYVLIPFYWLIIASTKSGTALFRSNTFVPSGYLIQNLRSVFTYDGSIFGQWIVNSLVYATVVSVLGTYLGTLCGYALAKYRFVGRGALLATVLGSLMIPSTVLAVPLFILERHLHLTNTYEGLILPLAVFPFGVYFMSIYSAGAVPNSLLDAGRVDGAGEWRIFHRVSLPLLVPGAVTMVLISFVGTWNNFFLPLVLMSNEHRYPLTVGLSIWNSNLGFGMTQPLYPDVILGSLVAIVPMLILFPFLQRYVARGLVMGAVAGE
jgi:multiple sugar transport system permease protein